MIPLREAAIEFGVSEATIYRYLARRQLTRHKRGMDRKTYIDRDQLQDLLQIRPVDIAGTGTSG